jgi:hypothetical protein
MSKAKWLIPLIVIVAMLAAVGIVWTQSSSNDGGTAGLPDVTDINPAYDNQVVTPGESAPIALWTVAIDPPTSTVPLGGGALATITVTNNIPAPLNNGTAIGRYGPLPGVPEMITANGDLTGDIIITADVENVIEPDGCIAVYPPTMTQNVVVKRYDDITVHPGGTVTVQVPILPGMQAIPGALFMLKAEFFNVEGLSTPLNPYPVIAAVDVEPLIESVTPNYLPLAQFVAASTAPFKLELVGSGFGSTTVGASITIAPSPGSTTAAGTVVTASLLAVTDTVVKVLISNVVPGLYPVVGGAGLYDVTFANAAGTYTKVQGLVITQ